MQCHSGSAVSRLNSSSSTIHSISSLGQLSLHVDQFDCADDVYRMDHPKRGRFVIINNRKFLPETKMQERAGTDSDAANLYTTFKKLGFDIQMSNNQTKAQMLQIVIKGDRHLKF